MVQIEPVPPEVAALLEVRGAYRGKEVVCVLCVCEKWKNRLEKTGATLFFPTDAKPTPLSPPPQDTAWRPQRLSEADKAPQITLGGDGTASSAKGYCVVSVEGGVLGDRELEKVAI